MDETQEKLIKSINKKIDSANVYYNISMQIAKAYEIHIFGEAKVANPKKKNDFVSYYNEVGELIDLSKKEIRFLSNEDEMSLIVFTSRLLDREGSRNLLEEIVKKEYALNYSQWVDKNPNEIKEEIDSYKEKQEKTKKRWKQ